MPDTIVLSVQLEACSLIHALRLQVSFFYVLYLGSKCIPQAPPPPFYALPKDEATQMHATFHYHWVRYNEDSNHNSFW
jgi:hypothetical protein